MSLSSSLQEKRSPIDQASRLRSASINRSFLNRSTTISLSEVIVSQLDEIFTREPLVSVVNDGSIGWYWLNELERARVKLSIALSDADEVDGRIHDSN